MKKLYALVTYILTKRTASKQDPIQCEKGLLGSTVPNQLVHISDIRRGNYAYIKIKNKYSI